MSEVLTEITGAAVRAAEVRVDVALLPLYEEMEGIKIALELKQNAIKTTEELVNIHERLVKLEGKHRDSNGVWHAEEIIDTAIEPTKESAPVLHGQASLTFLNERAHRLARSIFEELSSHSGGVKNAY